jgi:hypothetical protein
MYQRLDLLVSRRNLRIDSHPIRPIIVRRGKPTLRRWLEGSAIGVLFDISGLVVDHRFNQGCEVFVRRKEIQIVCKLNVINRLYARNKSVKFTWFAVSRSH